jgi:hypothetical protein
MWCVWSEKHSQLLCDATYSNLTIVKNYLRDWLILLLFLFQNIFFKFSGWKKDGHLKEQLRVMVFWFIRAYCIYKDDLRYNIKKLAELQAQICVSHRITAGDKSKILLAYSPVSVNTYRVFLHNLWKIANCLNEEYATPEKRLITKPLSVKNGQTWKICLILSLYSRLDKVR